MECTPRVKEFAMPRHPLLAALSLFVAMPAFAFDVSRVSLDGRGNQIPQDSRSAAISSNGRFLVFTTVAGLVPADSNSHEDVYLRDIQTGEVKLLSRSITGASTDRPSGEVDVTGDGSFVVFASSASNLVRDDNAGHSDIFIYSRAEDSLTRLTRGFDGSEADGGSGRPKFSADGKVIVFESRATNLIDTDTNGIQDIYIHGLVSGATRRVSVTSEGEELTGQNHSPSISGDGLKVAFTSLAPEINQRARSGLSEVFIHDLVTGNTSGVTVADGNSEPSDVFGNPFLSADGGWLAFTRTRNGGTGVSDILLQELETGETTRVTKTIGEPGTAFHRIGGIANEASGLAFDSIADNLVPRDTNGQKDVFNYDRVRDRLTRVSGPGPIKGGNGESTALGVSPDGNEVLFASKADNLVRGDTNDAQDIFTNNLSVFSLDSRVSGSWYDESQDGHGFSLEYLFDGRLVFYWFTFLPEGGREWIFGVLDVAPGSTVAEGEAFRQLGDGARFPPAINPSAINTVSWGTIRFEFTDCANGKVSWNAEPPYGNGSMDLSRLTPALDCP